MSQRPLVSAGLTLWLVAIGLGNEVSQSVTAGQPARQPGNERPAAVRRGGKPPVGGADGVVGEFGVLASARQSWLSSAVAGESVIVSLVPEGAKVEKGDEVAQLGSAKLRERVAEQRIVVARAAAAVQEAETATTFAETMLGLSSQQAELAVKLAALRQRDVFEKGGEYDLDLGVAATRLEAARRRRDLVRSKTETEEGNVPAVRAELAVREAEFTAADRDLKVLRRSRERRSVELELAVVGAKADLAKLRTEARHALASNRALLASAKAESARERGVLADLERQLAGTVLRAPQDGVVVYATPTARRTAGSDTIEVGTMVRERQPILSVVDTSKLQVVVGVHESRIADVKKGQSATIRVDAFPKQSFKGRVLSVSTVPSPGDWRQPDRREYRVVVSIEQPQPSFRIGLTALVEISVADEK